MEYPKALSRDISKDIEDWALQEALDDFRDAVIVWLIIALAIVCIAAIFIPHNICPPNDTFEKGICVKHIPIYEFKVYHGEIQ